MESSLQKIIAAIVGVMILFIIPVYIAFEKVDDISYSLVLKFTQAFVDNVREKGYISPDMYSDFVGNVYSTNNSYDIQIEHVKKRYDPAIYIYDTNGEILHILDYDKYIDAYNESKENGSIKLEIDEGIYTDKNTDIKVTKPSIALKNGEYIEYDGIIYDTEEKQEEFYRNYILNYREHNEKRIILDKGKIYADRVKLLQLNKEFDEDIYIDSNIELYDGSLRVVNRKYEPSNIMEYNDYINNYDHGFKLEIAGTVYDVFYGPTFNSSNAIIKNTKAALWFDDGRSYNELSNAEKKEAETRYYERIEDFRSTNNTAIIDEKGEIYAYSTSKDYEPLTDYLATNISVYGSIYINNPETWRVSEIEFSDSNIKKLRKGQKVVADNGGTYDNINIVAGSITKASNGKNFEYNQKIIDDLLDSSNSITIERAEVYGNENIILSDDARVTVRHISGYTNPGNVNPYIDNEPIYTQDLNYWISNLDEYIALTAELSHLRSVTVGGTEYSLDDGYEIQITKPTSLYCYGQADSDINLTSNIDDYINEYNLNGEIVFSRTYNKSALNVQFERIEILNDEGGLEYLFSENESPSEYRQYKSEYDNTGKISVKKLEYSADELTINYDVIVIEYNDENNESQVTIIDSSEDGFSNYLDGYYENQRIVRKVSKIYKNVKTIDPKIEIYSKDNTLLYKYERESKDVEEIFLWEKYSNEADVGTVTIVYKKSDVNVVRAKMVISEVAGGEFTIEDNSDFDGDNKFEYFDYKKEFEAEGRVTFNSSKYYTADELVITNPRVTIYNKQTGAIIKEYTVDFDSSDIYESYEQKKSEYETNFVIKDNPITYENNKNCLITIGHVINEERITDKQIVSKLFSGTNISKAEFLSDCLAGNVDLYKSLAYVNENSYTMNEGDKIIVTVRNRNTTIASTFYSLLTANVGNEDIAKIYVNYGGNIKNDGATLLNEQEGSIYNEMGRLFKYKGIAEEVTLTPGIYEVECWGASGGGYGENTNFTGGKGAYIKAKMTIKNTNKTFFVYAGGAGSEYSDDNKENGGWNGGGNSYQGYGGGGASDIRLIKGETDADATSQNSLLSRIMVAAGGGGSSKEQGKGGNAGNNVNGSDGTTLNADKLYVGKGAISGGINTKNGYTGSFGSLSVENSYENGSLGVGGGADYLGAGAGGAGLVGGSASHNAYAGGGGGLSYVYNNSILTNITCKEIWDFYQENIQNSDIQSYITGDVNLPIEVADLKWSNIEISDIVVTSGNEVCPNPIEYSGQTTINGNIGNGYVRIKKLN